MNRPLKTTRKRILSTWLLLALCSVFLVVAAGEQFSQLDRLVYDTFLRNFSKSLPNEEIVIVDIDENSLGKFGQWPWPRNQLASLIHSIADGTPAAIGIDILFAEEDRTSPINISEKLKKNFNVQIDTSDLPMAYLDNDYAFSLALKRENTYLGIMFLFSPPQGTEKQSPPASSLKIVHIDHGNGERKERLYRASNMVQAVPLLTAAASGVGFVNTMPDMDGIIRKTPLLLSYQGEIYPSLALTTYMQYEKNDTVMVVYDQKGVASIRIGKKDIPTDSKGNLSIRFIGPENSYPSLSAAAVLDGTVPPSRFKNKIVFVGSSAEGLKDIKSTPFDRNFPGVKVHASLVDTLLSRKFINIHVWNIGERLIATLVTTLLALAVSLWLPVWVTAATLLTFLFVIPVYSIFLFSEYQIFFSPVMPVLAYLLSFSALALVRFRSDEIQEVKHAHQLSIAQNSAIIGLASLVEARDSETGNHILRTQRYIKVLAEYLQEHGKKAYQMTDKEIELLTKTSVLHDIGKVGVRDSILLKPGRLTQEEFEEMKQHTVYGATVLQKARSESTEDTDQLSYLKMAEEIAIAHHEKWDGSGYPYGLAGEKIPLPGRLMAVADVYDALISKRVYKMSMPHKDSAAYILESSGSHFDPIIANAFKNLEGVFRDIATEYSD